MTTSTVLASDLLTCAGRAVAATRPASDIGGQAPMPASRTFHGHPSAKPKVRKRIAPNVYHHIASGRFEVGYRDPSTGRWIMKRLPARNGSEARRQARELLGRVESGEIKPADRT